MRIFAYLPFLVLAVAMLVAAYRISVLVSRLVSRLVPPHGAPALEPLLLADEELEEERARAARMPRIPSVRVNSATS